MTRGDEAMRADITSRDPEWWELEHNLVSRIQNDDSHIIYLYTHQTPEGWEYALVTYKGGRLVLLRKFIHDEIIATGTEDAAIWVRSQRGFLHTFPANADMNIGGGDSGTWPARVRIQINSGEGDLYGGLDIRAGDNQKKDLFRTLDFNSNAKTMAIGPNGELSLGIAPIADCAVLEVQGHSGKGSMPYPSYSTEQRDRIPKPWKSGLGIWNTDRHQIEIWDGLEWQTPRMTSAG
jgi:hypothetical protein